MAVVFMLASLLSVGEPGRVVVQEDGTASSELTKPAASPQEDIDRIVGCFVETLHNQDLPFVKPPQLKELRNELRDYLSPRVTRSVTGEYRQEIMDAVADQVKSRFRDANCYLSFRSGFDMLKWQIWTAMERQDLTAEQSARRETQRKWMRDYIISLPDQQQRVPDWQHAGRLKVLEDEVFQNPLSPFFHEPMSDETFRQFQAELTNSQRNLPDEFKLVHAPSHIFFAAVKVQADSMRNRWPPGFPVAGLGMGGTKEFSFRATPLLGIYIHLGRSLENQRAYFDLASKTVVFQPAPFDPESTRQWRARTGDRGDLYLDSGKLITAGGAKMALLEETQWYALDRLTITQLRELIARSSVDSYSLSDLPQVFFDGMSATGKAKTIVLQNSDGQLALLRIQQKMDDDIVIVQIRPRPLPPYPPFHPGDEPDASDGK